MRNNRVKATGKGAGGSFVKVPHRMLNSDRYKSLSSKGVKLLMDIFAQFNGKNNGDFSIAWKLMKERGWKSKQTLHAAKDELIEKELIVLTRQGGKHQCSLFAVSWLAIHECNGKLDAPPTTVPPVNWSRYPGKHE